ncbi:3-oxoacyl-ACP synthase III family protein [Kibdelosporangium philippinense]|uniref:3-oxoacyl-ACP synthase III family protein n=1 Tax=Kibdelosporangium philippinense TaxID=211113 RepID=A0ABS8Z644_9PSEU|nr:3-oxoacyl-ACP synthase III family protein [Kibdelosporangium philippinense]MCE7002111.1 3-oxoacyl-ACP synthase III family protein [Kibdelosporangium philippinense]
MSTGTALPGEPVDNESIARKFGTDANWAEAFIGTRQRHFAVDLNTGQVTHTLADLGAQACAQAMARADLEPRDVDFLVLGTSSPDALMPATVNLIADRLGIDQVSTYQLQSGCAGALQALDLACRLLDEEHLIGVVVGADVCVKHLVLDQKTNSVRPASHVLFGDGAGAAVLASELVPGSIAVRRVLNRYSGLSRTPGQVVRWFGAADLTQPEQPVEQDHKAIAQRVPLLARQAMREVLGMAGWYQASVSYLLPPQLSGRLPQRVANALGLTDVTEISCVADVGNAGNALPFFQLDRLHDRIVAEERAIAIAIEPSKWIKTAVALEGM